MGKAYTDNILRKMEFLHSTLGIQKARNKKQQRALDRMLLAPPKGGRWRGGKGAADEKLT